MDLLGSRFENTTFAFVDVETTGLRPQHDRIVEVACVLTRGGRRVDSFESLIDPGRPIPATASAVHHLTDESVRDAPTLESVTPWLRAFARDAVIVAHNASFDLGFLPFLRERPTLCSMRFAQLVLPDAPNYKNQVLRYHIGVRDPLLAAALPHRALGDAIVTSLIFDYCVTRYLAGGGLDDVAHAIERTHAPRQLPALSFGRYRGRPIADLPDDYLKWLVFEAVSPSQDVRFTASAELERRAASCHACDVVLQSVASMSDEIQSNGLRLKALLKDGGVTSTRLDATRRLVMFTGRTRDWSFYVNLYNGWFHIYAYVCELPQGAALRVQLLDAAMAANHTMSLTKFVKGDGLILELEYREEHVDGEVARNLLGLALSNAEECYPRLFRIVSGDAVLETLADGGTLPQLTG